MSTIPRPLPASSKALRQHRTEVDLVVDHVRDVDCPVHELDDPDCRPEHGGPCLGRRRRIAVETGRFRVTVDARRWAVARLVELDPELNPAAVLVTLSASDGWRPHDVGRITLDEAREELDR